MPIFANQRWFERPDSRLTAIGAKHGSEVWEGGMSDPCETVGGLVNPRRVVLGVGARLIRFGKRSQTFLALNGEWWLGWSQYELVVDYADRRGHSLPKAMAELCQIAPEWSDLSTMVQARLIKPLLAWSGPGAALDTPSAKIPRASERIGRNVHQLYIPGLGHPDLRREVLVWSGQGYFDAT